MGKTFVVSKLLLMLQIALMAVESAYIDRLGKGISDMDLMPITKISGTDLYTGIFYRVGMKAFTRGWVTWFRNKFLEININPDDLPNYAPGGPSQYDNQWVFGVSEFSDAFTLANRGRPLGLVTWDSFTLENGHYVGIIEDPSLLKKMAQGGEWRVDSLWTPIATDETNMYKLTNQRRYNEFLTWARTMSNNYNYYIKIAADEGAHSKLSFKTCNFQLEALIHDFEFQHALSDIIESRKRNQELENITLEYEISVPNPTSNSIKYFVFENVQTVNQIGILLDQTFKTVPKFTVSIPELLPNGTTKFSFDGGFEANKTIAVEVRKTIPAKMKINVPSGSNRKVSICTEWANDIEMPFNAKMTVTGITERMATNHVNTTVEGPIPGDALRDMLNISGDHGDNIEILHESKNELVVLVSGVLTGNIAIKSFVGSLSIQGCGLDIKTNIARINDKNMKKLI